MATEQVRRRRGGRSAQVRAAVLKATLEVLAESGPAELSIAQIATRAGVHETSVYRRWGTRERLMLDALVERSADLLRVPDTGSVREDLVVLGRQLVDYGSTPLGETLCRTLAACADDADAAATRSRFWRTRHDECQVLVERARVRGELPASVDGRMLLEMFISPIHFRLLLTREAVGNEFLETLADVVVTGVAATATETPQRQTS